MTLALRTWSEFLIPTPCSIQHNLLQFAFEAGQMNFPFPHLFLWLLFMPPQLRMERLQLTSVVPLFKAPPPRWYLQTHKSLLCPGPSSAFLPVPHHPFASCRLRLTLWHIPYLKATPCPLSQECDISVKPSLHMLHLFLPTRRIIIFLSLPLINYSSRLILGGGQTC